MRLHRNILPILAVGVVRVCTCSQPSLAFQQLYRGYLHSHSIGRPTVVSLSNGRFDREFDEKASMRAAEKAAGKGAGEAAAGAILGGLVFGPFGALFGAQVGASMGSRRAFDSERQKEMEKMGISKDMLKNGGGSWRGFGTSH